MDDSTYAFLEIQRRMRHVAERVCAKVVHWRQDSRDPRRIFITARLWLLPAKAKPVQLELFLPSLRTQL